MRFDSFTPQPRARSSPPLRLAALALAALCWHAAQAEPREPAREGAGAPAALLYKIEHGLRHANDAAIHGTRRGLEAASRGTARSAHAAAPYLQRGAKAVERVALGVKKRLRHVAGA